MIYKSIFSSIHGFNERSIVAIIRSPFERVVVVVVLFLLFELKCVVEQILGEHQPPSKQAIEKNIGNKKKQHIAFNRVHFMVHKFQLYFVE